MIGFTQGVDFIAVVHNSEIYAQEVNGTRTKMMMRSTRLPPSP